MYGMKVMRKIFPNDKAFETITPQQGFPMGKPSPRLMKGSVQLGSNRPKRGFAIVSRWSEGTGFFGKTDGSLTKALTKEEISHV